MARVWSILVVMVACLIAVNFVSAQEKKGGRGRDPVARWAAIAKAAGQADAKSLKVDQFIDGYVKSIPDSAPQQVKDGAKDRATKTADKIKDADGNVTQDAFVKYMKEMAGKRKGEKKA